jgi:hypothetical protein
MQQNIRSKTIKRLAIAFLLGITLFLMTSCGPGDETSPTISAVPSLEMETPPPTQPQPAPVESQVPAVESGLSATGPWILLSTESGLWAMNEDGSGLTQLTQEPAIAPQDLKSAVSWENPYVAYITANDPLTLQGLTLNLLTLPEGAVEPITPLTSPGTESQSNLEICDPIYEGARAITIGNSLAWSPDGAQLAFTGSMQGDSADVYIYSLAEKSITRLSAEPGQAYDLHWAPGGQNLVFFSASCFGTGAGFDMEAAWATRPGDGRVIELYQPDPEGWGETFIGWQYNEPEAFFVATASGCPYKDLRLVDIETQEIQPIYQGCFNDVTTGPTNLLGVLASSDFSEQPGLYIYQEPHREIPPVYVPEPNGRQVRLDDIYFLYSVFTDQGVEIHSVDFYGKPGEYQGKGDFPVFSQGGDIWAWNDSGNFYLSGKEMNAPITLNISTALYPFWNESGNQMDGFQKRLFFFIEGDTLGLYMAVDPEYQPVLLSDKLKPLSTPVMVWP